MRQLWLGVCALWGCFLLVLWNAFWDFQSCILGGSWFAILNTGYRRHGGEEITQQHTFSVYRSWWIEWYLLCDLRSYRINRPRNKASSIEWPKWRSKRNRYIR